MELGGRSVGRGVIGPGDLARSPVQSEELAGAGADKEVVPRDRGGDEDSASGIERPGDRFRRTGRLRESQDEQELEQRHVEDHAPFYERGIGTVQTGSASVAACSAPPPHLANSTGTRTRLRNVEDSRFRGVGVAGDGQAVKLTPVGVGHSLVGAAMEIEDREIVPAPSSVRVLFWAP